MKKKKIYTWKASTLAEILVVMIVSGILLIALFDGMDLVKRYTSRLKRRLLPVETLLDRFQRMESLFRMCDSIQRKGDVCTFYWGGEPQAVIEKRDSLLCGYRGGRKDTLFRTVTDIQTLAVRENPVLVDSLIVSFVYRGRLLRFSFGLIRRPEREIQNLVDAWEDNYKQENKDGME